MLPARLRAARLNENVRKHPGTARELGVSVRTVPAASQRDEERWKIASRVADAVREVLLAQSERRRLRRLRYVKDDYFKEAISDGLRHGSSLCAKYMADRREYLRSLRK
ncbi:MAG: hypothetical protein PUD02_01510 [Eggerthellales bacterium]|nr:hypothetical protein [Eggerthellales bacterium]